MTKYALALLFACAPSLLCSAQAADIKGTWLTEEGKARVLMSPCGANICGRIVWLKEPNDTSGKPLVDALNHDRSLRSRPIMGLQLAELKAGGDGSWKGEIYSPEEGKSYNVEASIQPDGSLRIKGCILGGLVCDSQIWKRDLGTTVNMRR